MSAIIENTVMPKQRESIVKIATYPGVQNGSVKWNVVLTALAKAGITYLKDNFFVFGDKIEPKGIITEFILETGNSSYDNYSGDLYILSKKIYRTNNFNISTTKLNNPKPGYDPPYNAINISLIFMDFSSFNFNLWSSSNFTLDFLRMTMAWDEVVGSEKTSNTGDFGSFIIESIYAENASVPADRFLLTGKKSYWQEPRTGQISSSQDINLYVKYVPIGEV